MKTREEELYYYIPRMFGVANIVHEDIFLSVCSRTAFNNWDHNYFCMLEQIHMEGLQ